MRPRWNATVGPDLAANPQRCSPEARSPFVEPSGAIWTTTPTPPRCSVLGEDSSGLWLGIRRGDRWLRDGQPVQAAPTDIVELIPNEIGWVAEWYEELADGPENELYCDVVGPSLWDGTVVTSVDLDLDVIRTFSGETKLLDEDEFEEHQIELGYPEVLVVQAREVASSLMRRVSDRAAPFDGSHHRWMDVWKSLRP